MKGCINVKFHLPKHSPGREAEGRLKYGGGGGGGNSGEGGGAAGGGGFRPGGKLSAALMLALGMASEDSPPPWLFNMQRYGAPPAYPTLKIPGLNAPIPEGGVFGTQPGGWGRPPLDEMGNPRFGDWQRMEEERKR